MLQINEFFYLINIISLSSPFQSPEPSSSLMQRGMSWYVLKFWEVFLF